MVNVGSLMGRSGEIVEWFRRVDWIFVVCRRRGGGIFSSRILGVTSSFG